MIAACLLVLCALEREAPDLFKGRSVQIDPGFPYYQNRSAESIAKEIKGNGYNVVRYVVTNDEAIRKDLIMAFHKHGMLVWYLTFGNGFYGSPPKSMPQGWEKWKTVFIGTDANEGYTFLSLSHQEYRAWKARQIVEVVRKYAFDGVEVVEPFQMGWGGPETGLYGDFSPAALSRFEKQYGYTEPPNFRDPSNPKWYKTDTKRYASWCDFRVAEVSSFLKELRDAVKSSIKNKPFSVWMLANSSPIQGKNPRDLLREWQGIDAESVAKTVKPDLICFQTNWPDWSNPLLAGDYVKLYRPFIDPIKNAYPTIPLIVQADTGSLKPMRRSRQWINLFEKTCSDLGVGSTYYMYDISLWHYTEAPRLLNCEVAKDGVILTFQKCIDPRIEKELDRIVIAPKCRIVRAKCDGNLLKLNLTGLVKGVRYRLSIQGLGDDTKRRLFDDYPQQKSDIKTSFKALSN